MHKLVLGLMLAAFGFTAVAADINVNEKVVREELEVLTGKANMTVDTAYYFNGTQANGKACTAQITTRYKDKPNVKDPNGTTSIDFEIFNDTSRGDVFVGFDGEGPPEKFMGKPLNSYQVKGSNVVLKMDHQEEEKFAEHWKVTMNFSSGTNLRKLTEISSYQIRVSEEAEATECAKMKLVLALDNEMYETIEKDINAELKKRDRDSKIEIFNGCNPTSGVGRNGSVKVSCGFAIDEENDHQGTATFVVDSDNNVQFVNLKMLSN